VAKDKERLARELGADEYIDTEASDPAQELLRMGGARVVLATAPSGGAMASIIGGIGIHGQLLVVAAPRMRQSSTWLHSLEAPALFRDGHLAPRWIQKTR